MSGIYLTLHGTQNCTQNIIRTQNIFDERFTMLTKIHMALIAHPLCDSYHQGEMYNFCQNCHAKQMSSLLCTSH